MRTEKELRALVTLLGDEDGRVAHVAWETLRAEGDTALPFLAEASNSPEPLLRGRARMVLEELRRGTLEAKWRRFSERSDPDMDLEEGCLLLASLAGYDQTESVPGFLDAIAGMVRAAMVNDGGLQALGEVLFENLGFRGGDFKNPDSHYLPTVLDRRAGIPIALATLFVLVGRRAGLPVSGASMPGHFLARYERPNGPIFIDCYNRGRVLYFETLVGLLESKGIEFSERYLAPCPPRLIFHRMLNNLEQLHTEARDSRSAERVVRLRDSLQVR